MTVLAILYRILIIYNLNSEKKKINRNFKNSVSEILIFKNPLKNKLCFFEFKIKENINNEIREVFLEKVEEEYEKIDDEKHKKLKENITKIYNRQKLDKLTLLKTFPILSFIGYIINYLKNIDNKGARLQNILNIVIIKNNKSAVINWNKIGYIVLTLVIFYIMSYLFYKKFEIKVMKKRERISQVAECIDNLKK